MRLLSVAILLICLLAPLLARADATTIAGQHRFISVVPAPGPVTLDGKLDEWDLSGEILSYEFVETGDKRHARTAMMYDKDALYVGVYFRDFTSPMMNMVDGRVDKSRGWDADAFQMRLVIDPAYGFPLKVAATAPIVRDCIMWYYTGKKEPTISINKVNVTPVLEMQYLWDTFQLYYGEDSGLAFRQADDGYYLEARIPWARMGMPGAPAAGSKVPLTAQFLWGNDKGTKVSTSVNDITNVGGGFTYQSVGGWGYALFEPTGKLARAREELPKPVEIAKTLSLNFTLPVERQVSLGIFDKDGRLVRTLLTAEKRPAGKIDEKWDGLNDFGEVLPAGKYTVKGLTRGDLSQEWIVSLHNSGNPPWVTPDGKGSWGGDHGSPQDAACSADRVFLIWDIAEAGWNLIGCTLDGQKQWGVWTYANYPPPISIATDGKLVFVCQQAGITTQDAMTGKPVNFAGDKRCIDIEGGGATDIVYRDGHCYVLAKDKVFDIQLDQGKVVKSYAVGSGTKGLALVPNSPYLLTVQDDGAVVRIDPRYGSATPIFVATLAKPFDLTLSPDGKKLFITDRGRTENVVKVYGYPDGKPQGFVGKPGGRPALGKFDPSGLFNPGGLAFDAQGRLWVTESDPTPKRISVWQPDGKQGKLLTEYFGPSAYSVGLSADPEKPEYVYLHNTRWIVDYDKRTAKLDCTFMRPDYYGPQPAINGWMGQYISFAHVNGRTFLYMDGSVWEMLDDHAVPVYAVSWMPRARNWSVPDVDRADNWAYTCYWSDSNRDGFIQPEEVESIRTAGLKNGDAVTPRNDPLAFNSSSQLVGVKEWKNGLPIWYKPFELKDGFPTEVTSNWPGGRWNPDRSRFYVLETNDGYYTNDMRRNGLACYTADGKKLWRFVAGIGMDLSAPLTKPGQVRGAQRVIGFVETGAGKGGELFAVNGYYGNYNLLNEDGLFVGEFCHDNRRGHPLDNTVLLPEGFGGYLLQHPKTKKVYLMGGDSDGRIWEIKGLDTLARFQQPLTITPQDVDNAAKALADFQKAGGGVITTVALKRPATPITVDGGLDEWDFNQAAKIDAGPGRGGKALAAWDDKNLYVAYRVADDSPFVNTGTDFPYLFKTGDLVDLMLGTDPAADAKRKAGKGDMRLLFAPYQGKPVVILNQKVADGGPAAPLTFTSPTGTEAYERVAILDGAQVAVKTTPDGYTLEAAIPLALLGFTPQPRMAYGIDFGILYGDPAGAKTLMRAYWANKNTSIIGDIPTESRITPEYLGKGMVE